MYCKFFTRKEGCWWISDAGSSGKGYLDFSSFLSNSLQCCAHKCHGTVSNTTSSSTQHHHWLIQIHCLLYASRFTQWLPPLPKTPMPSFQKYSAVDFLPMAGVCEDSEMDLLTTFCQIPSMSSLWCFPKTSLMAQLIKNPPIMQETPVWFLGWEDPLEKG